MWSFWLLLLFVVLVLLGALLPLRARRRGTGRGRRTPGGG
jgi:hypothetical protein